MNASSAVVHVSGVWRRVQRAGRFVRPTDRKASDRTRVAASGRSTTLPSRPSRTLRNPLTRRTVSADRSRGPAHETRPLPESIVFLSAVLSSPQHARTSNGHAWRVSFRIAAVQRQLVCYEENHHRRLEPLTPEARISQTVVAQIARIPHRPVCRIKCTCPGFLGFLARESGKGIAGKGIGRYGTRRQTPVDSGRFTASILVPHILLPAIPLPTSLRIPQPTALLCPDARHRGRQTPASANTSNAFRRQLPCSCE
jgi:hypothetical protein